MSTKKKSVTRLEDLVVEEVSIVDKPANLRRFLMLKNEDEASMKTKGTEIFKDKDGNLVAKKTETSEAPTVEVEKPDETSNEIVKNFSNLGELIQKRLSVTSSARKEIYSTLSETMSRLYTVMNTTDYAQTDMGEGDSKLVPVLAAELAEIAKDIGALAKSLGSVVKKSDENSDSVESKLESLIDAVQSEIVEKAGMSKGSAGKLKNVIATLSGMVKEFEGGKVAPTSTDTDKSKGKVTKSEDEEKPAEVVALEKSVVDLSGQVSQLLAIVKTQNKTLVKIKKSRGGSNAIAVDSSEKEDQTAFDDKWGLDLNEDKSRENIDKAIDFND
jgi:phage-related protein